MATYNTRGTKHRSFDRNYDVKFNRGFFWSGLFDIIAGLMILNIKTVSFSRHIYDYLAAEDTIGNRAFKFEDLKYYCNHLMDMLPIEIEAEHAVFPNGQEAFIIRKLLLRGDSGFDGEDICLVLDFTNPVYPKLKTAYLNKSDDHHHIGLDVSDMNVCTKGLFGFETSYGEAKVFSAKERDGSLVATREFVDSYIDALTSCGI